MSNENINPAGELNNELALTVRSSLRRLPCIVLLDENEVRAVHLKLGLRRYSGCARISAESNR